VHSFSNARSSNCPMCYVLCAMCYQRWSVMRQLNLMAKLPTLLYFLDLRTAHIRIRAVLRSKKYYTIRCQETARQSPPRREQREGQLQNVYPTPTHTARGASGNHPQLLERKQHRNFEGENRILVLWTNRRKRRANKDMKAEY
jgi:hypothetical protein